MNRNRRHSAILMTFGMIVLVGTAVFAMVLAAEALLFVSEGFYGGFQRYEGIYFNRPCTRFDSQVGCRWVPGRHRAMRVANGRLAFDTEFSVNRQGFVSSKDYSAKKKDPGAFRFILFGDSFSDGYYLGECLADVLEARLNAAGAGRFEVYSFAMDGIGIANWHALFLNDVLPYYEFDGMIVAAFSGDLHRLLTIRHVENGDYGYERYEERFRDLEDFLEKGWPEATMLGKIISDGQIDELRGRLPVSWRSWKTPPLKWRVPGVFGFFFERLRFVLGTSKARLRARVKGLDDKTGFRDWRRVGPVNTAKFEDLLTHCRENGKPFIYAAVPWIYHLKIMQNWPEYEPPYTMRRGRELQEKYGIPVFDGHGVFMKLPEGKTPADYYLRHDGHWNLRGMHRFADYFAEYILGVLSSSGVSSSARGNSS